MLGVRIDNFTLNEALEKIREFLADGKQHYIVTPNPDFLVRAQKDKEFREILNRADLSLADGIGIVWASHLFCDILKERVSGADLVEQMQKENFSKFFLLDNWPGVAKKAAARWQSVVGFSENSESAVKEINEFQPKILLVGLGSPRQEKWIDDNLQKIPSVKVAIGVGGSLYFAAGLSKRAPKFLQKAGLEWFWRVFGEPWRWKKILRSVIVFPWLVIKEKVNL